MRGVIIAIPLLALYACGGEDAGTPPSHLDEVRSLTAQVRAMADDNEIPHAGTLLEQTMLSNHRTVANCVDFALTLIALIQQYTALEAHAVGTCLVPNTFDCHTLVEVNDAGRWVLFDPSFGMVPHNASGALAVKEDLATAVRTRSWSDLSYEYVTTRGSFYATRNYIDWPLYFVHPYSLQTSLELAKDMEALNKYYVPLGNASSPGVYALQCQVGADTATATIDGKRRTLSCDPDLGISHIVKATTVMPEAGAVVLEPQRFVFDWDGTCNVVSACT